MLLLLSATEDKGLMHNLYIKSSPELAETKKSSNTDKYFHLIG